MSTTRSFPDARQPEAAVGGYHLLTKIGEGGMGVVHLAQAPDGSRVALKVLRPHIVGDSEARERLGREVASLRRVRSPRIAEIIDADPWGETPFVVTRYVPGLSLHEHTRQEGPLGGEDLRHFAAGLAEAVLAVHSVGVLHRDIKPSNVLLEGRSPVLIDFGLARLAEDSRLTMTGWLLGTPGYLAPEILFGDDATTASDVHSWAATVVFAATGRPPFGRGPAMAVMDRVRRGEHDLTGVPSELRPLLVAALAPDPQARPLLPALLADLRPAAVGGAPDTGDRTVPLALASPAGPDATDLLPSAAPAPTRPLTGVLPQDVHHRPARAPYMQPAPPQQQQSPETPTWHPPPEGLARIQRAGILGSVFAGLSLAFAAAPYLTVIGVAVLALLLRTWSWTGQASRQRVQRRGVRRWYDGLLAGASAPWYLLVATAGTLLLVLWSSFLAVVTGFGVLVLGLPPLAGLVLMGVVLTFTLWWGPGARRVREPVRGLVLRATRRSWVGWGAVVVLGLAVVGCASVLLDGGTSWAPQPGPPWRDGTLLGDLVRFL